jgi:hypothetical protein
MILIHTFTVGRRTCAAIGSLASVVSGTLYAIGHAYVILAAGALS